MEQAQRAGTESGATAQVERRRLYNGFGDTLARAFELVVTPALFAVIGHFIDVWLGTNPVFTIALGIFCLVGMGVRMYYTYVATMKDFEAQLPGVRKVGTS